MLKETLVPIQNSTYQRCQTFFFKDFNVNHHHLYWLVHRYGTSVFTCYTYALYILTDLTWLVLYCTCTSQQEAKVIMHESNICKKFKMAAILMTIASIREQILNFWLKPKMLNDWKNLSDLILVRAIWSIKISGENNYNSRSMVHFRMSSWHLDYGSEYRKYWVVVGKVQIFDSTWYLSFLECE